MKYFWVTFLFFSKPVFAFSQELKRNELRTKFHNCTSKELTESLYLLIEKESDTSAIFTGYNGAVTSLRAKFNPNPFKKYNYCKEGIYQLSSSIERSSKDIELRYLRLLIESNIPSFLGLNNHVDIDKTYILKHLQDEGDFQLKKLILQFLLKSDICTDSEKKRLAVN